MPSKKTARPFKKESSRRSLSVNAYATSWLRKGFDWVYKKEITSSTKGVCKGDWIEIKGADHQFLGMGIWCGGPIACRRFANIRCEFHSIIEKHLTEALARRPEFSAHHAWRWVHAENDALPGIRIDVWGDVIVLTLFDAALRMRLNEITSALLRVYSAEKRSVRAIWGYIRGEKTIDLGCLHGDKTPKGHWVEEHGLRYWVEPFRSADAGLFSDMRDLRAWLEPHWRGRDCLNLFCFTGAFSVSAAYHGAKSICSVDLSPTYIEWAQKNFLENGLTDRAQQWMVSDAFKAVDRLRRKKQSFDRIVLDPPSFSHGDATWSIERDLSNMILRCLKILRPQGWLIVATNHGKISPKAFAKAILDASTREQRPVRIIKQYNPPMDFPAALSFPESRYLKCWVVQA